MILQVDEELYELILNTLMECGYDDAIEDIVVYHECIEEVNDESDDDESDDDNKPKSKKKKNKKICAN